MPTYTIGTDNGTGDTWMTWASTDTNSSTTIDNTWVLWVDAGGTANAAPRVYTAPPRTAEQIAADEEHAATAAQEVQERAAAQLMAGKRAQRLLAECLTAKQRHDLKRDDAFCVQIGERCYRINRGYSGNVELIEGDCVRARYCIHPREDVPNEDTMLAQKLLLEANEDEFLRVANATRVG